MTAYGAGQRPMRWLGGSLADKSPARGSRHACKSRQPLGARHARPLLALAHTQVLVPSHGSFTLVLLTHALLLQPTLVLAHILHLCLHTNLTSNFSNLGIHL
jgi:hypothetical protein